MLVSWQWRCEKSTNSTQKKKSKKNSDMRSVSSAVLEDVCVLLCLSRHVSWAFFFMIFFSRTAPMFFSPAPLQGIFSLTSPPLFSLPRSTNFGNLTSRNFLKMLSHAPSYFFTPASLLSIFLSCQAIIFYAAPKVLQTSSILKIFTAVLNFSRVMYTNASRVFFRRAPRSGFFSPAPRGGIFFLPRRANNYPRMCIFFAPPRAL